MSALVRGNGEGFVRELKREAACLEGFWTLLPATQARLLFDFFWGGGAGGKYRE